MNRERAAAIRARIEQAKDDTPSTSAFVWFVPTMVIIGVLTMNGELVGRYIQPEPVVCVLGVCW